MLDPLVGLARPLGSAGLPEEQELRPNILKERPPSPGLVVEGARPGKDRDGPGMMTILTGVLHESVDLVRQWHAELSRHLGGVGGWAVIALPLWLLLLLLGLRLRGPRRRVAPAGGRVGRSQATSREMGIVAPPATATANRSEETRASAPLQAPSAPLELTPGQRMLLAPEGNLLSLHETFVVLGAGTEATLALRRAVAGELGAATWAAAVNEQRADRLRPFRSHWVRAAAARQVERWLSRHPLVTSSGLQVQVPAVLEPGELDGLTLTLPSGLAAPITESLAELVQQGRDHLESVFVRSTDPYFLLEANERAGISQGAADQANDPREAPRSVSLALLLGGLLALDHQARWRQAVDGPGMWTELRQAMQEHAILVETPVPAEGCAVYALCEVGRPTPEGTGTLLAAVAGAAFSASAVLLKVSKLAGELPGSSRREVLVQLGRRLDGALTDPAGGEGILLEVNLRRLLGLELLQAEQRRCEELVRAVERLTAREPLWDAASAGVEPLDLLLARLHQGLVRQALHEAEGAFGRLLDILTRLAYPGQKGENIQGAALRLGYIVAGLGMPVLRSMGTEVLSMGREAEKLVRELVGS